MEWMDCVSVWRLCLTVCLGVNGRESVWNGGAVSIIGGSCHKCHLCRDKSMLVAINCLSRQKTCFVPTKHVLVAAPANDSVMVWGI